MTAVLLSEYITATWESSGAGVTGLTPSIRIIDLSDNSTAETGSMTEVDAVNAPGLYKYLFTTFDVDKKYAARLDGGVGTEDRYRTLQLRTDARAVSEYMDANSEKLAFLDINVSSVGSSGGWKGKPPVIDIERIVNLLLSQMIGEKTLRQVFEDFSKKKEVKESSKNLAAFLASLQDLQEVIIDSKIEVIGEIKNTPKIEFNEEIILAEVRQAKESILTVQDSAKKEICAEICSVAEDLKECSDIAIQESANDIKNRIAESQMTIPEDVEKIMIKRDAAEIKRRGVVLDARKKFENLQKLRNV